MSEGLFGIHAAALELRSQRMGLITSNIANAAALKAKSSGMDTDQAAAAATLYRLPLMPSLDGNTVELPTEQVAFAANAVGYASTLSFISDSVGEITRALKGD